MAGKLHDVKVEMKKCDEYVACESLPPDEIKVSRRHRWTSLMDADFVMWVRRITIGQARAEGFDVPDDAPGYQDQNQEWVSRERYTSCSDGRRQHARPDAQGDPAQGHLYPAGPAEQGHAATVARGLCCRHERSIAEGRSGHYPVRRLLARSSTRTATSG
jgi:hypothetical protein